MATPYASAAGSAPVPATKEFAAAWIAYALYAVSTFLLWPALIALVITYAKRGNRETGFIDSHHRWMLRSFWYSQLAYVFCFALALIGLWPVISDILQQVITSVQNTGEPTFTLDFDWKALFSTAGGAMIGGLGIVVTWFWYLYRLIRGMVTLSDARPMP